jgi:Domain of unknown function (DUF6249)
MESAKLLVPILGIVLGIGSPIIMLGLILLYKLRRHDRIHETALKLAEKGQPVPLELLGGVRKPDSDLRWGVVLTLFGLALTIAFSQVGAPWAFGLIPTFMGVGYLIVWKLETGRAQQS